MRWRLRRCEVPVEGCDVGGAENVGCFLMGEGWDVSVEGDVGDFHRSAEETV